MAQLEQPSIHDIAGHEVTPELVDRMLPLLDRAFGGWPRLGPSIDPVEHLWWKYADDPGGVRLVLAELEGRLVGMQCVQRQHWQVKGRSRSVRIGNDLSVDPDYQGRGIYTAIARYDDDVLSDYDMVLTYSTLPQTIRVTTRQGQKRMGPRVRFLMHVLNAGAFAGHTVKPGLRGALLRAAIQGAAWSASLRSRFARDVDSGLRVDVVDRFDTRVDAMLERARRRFDLVQLTDSNYLNWRFADPRAGDFTILHAESAGELVGYAVLKPGDVRAYVADLMTLPGRNDVAYGLLRTAVEVLAESEPEAIAAWIPSSHPFAPVYRRCGFVDSRGYTGASYRALGMDPTEVAFLSEPKASIHVAIGDTDHV